MAAARLEHANLTVSDPDRSAAFFAKLCGWHERWRGPSQLGGWTIHLGSETDYIALYTPREPQAKQTDIAEAQNQRFAKGVPLNHVGLVVDNLDAAEAVVKDAGLVPFNHADYEPGRRFYFFDWDGIEFEVISYG